MAILSQAPQTGNALTLPAARHRRPEPAKSFPVTWVARRARLPLQRARVVAELAGFSVEAAYV